MSTLDTPDKNLIKNPDSGFVNVRCPACGATTTTFTHATTPLMCSQCGASLGFPSGGQMKFLDGVQVKPMTD